MGDQNIHQTSVAPQTKDSQKNRSYPDQNIVNTSQTTWAILGHLKRLSVTHTSDKKHQLKLMRKNSHRVNLVRMFFKQLYFQITIQDENHLQTSLSTNSYLGDLLNS